MYIKFSLLFLFVNIILSSTIIITLCKSSYISTNNIQNVLEKLEAYVKESKQQSDLTIDEIKASFEEFIRLSVKRREILEEKRPLYHLLSDFLFIPMERFPEMIDIMGQNYISRLETNYKQFRGAYLGEPISRTYVHAEHIDTLISSLLELKDFKPLTESMLKNALDQYNAFYERLREIGKIEDIYACKEELTNTFNLLNRDMVKILANTILPLAEKTNYNLAALKELYKNELNDKYDIVVEDGQLVKIMTQ